MQRILTTELAPEDYARLEWHRQVCPEPKCPNCGKGRLNRHARYARGVTTKSGHVVRVWVARFLCLSCGVTVSYLPSFAMTYRLVSTEAFEAFLEGKRDGDEIRKWEIVLQTYRRRMLKFAAPLISTIGHGFSRAPPRPEALWRWLRVVHGSLAAAMHRLVTLFRITPFKRYQCHQPAAFLITLNRVPNGKCC